VTDGSGGDGTFNWNCLGAYGGTSAACVATAVYPVTGACGSGNGVTTPNIPSGSSACSAGTQSVTDSTGSDGAFNWTCQGAHGGGNATCSAPKTPPVNGQCGAGNNTVTPTIPTGTQACATGSQSVTDGSASDGKFDWNCSGLYGGSSAACSATKGILPGVGASFTGSRTVVALLVPLWYADALTWNFPNATACTASGAWTGAKATSGTQTLTASLGVTKTYTLTCTNTYGSATLSVTLVPP
jgi:hypothetical protein